ncbi:MAG: TPM domain-containing protein [Vicinamibacteria bacterium]|nr:TPM domain-containing protein [Vicinamibacteria bacterium]
MSASFFSRIDEPRVVEAIRLAELRCRGEIRVHVTGKPVSDVIKEATATFERLGMTATAERNGVLIFVASRSQKFAVLGDSGMTSIVGTHVLDEMAASMSTAFREGRFTDGLVAAVERAGDLLAAHFPRVEGVSDENELSNDISRG